MSRVLVVDGDRAARDALVTCLKFVGLEVPEELLAQTDDLKRAYLAAVKKFNDR